MHITTTCYRQSRSTLQNSALFRCAVLTSYQPKLKSLLSRSLAYAYIRRPAALFTCTVRYTRRPVAYLRLTRCCYISRTVDTAPLTYILYARQPYTGPRCWAQAYVRCAAFYNDDGRTADERKIWLQCTARRAGAVQSADDEQIGQRQLRRPPPPVLSVLLSRSSTAGDAVLKSMTWVASFRPSAWLDFLNFLFKSYL